MRLQAQKDDMRCKNIVMNELLKCSRMQALKDSELALLSTIQLFQLNAEQLQYPEEQL